MSVHNYRLDEIKKYWPRSIPSGKALEFVLLDKDAGMDTHNRFILTERGGLKFAWGLDTSTDGAKDVVNVMAEDTHAAMFKEYGKLTGRTEVERFKIIGTKNYLPKSAAPFENH